MTAAKKRFATATLFIILLCLNVNASHASTALGAKGSGMATAFVAVADNPSTIAYNPAGIAGLKGQQIYGGLSLLIPHSTYTSPTGQQQRLEDQIFYAPSLYYTSDTSNGNISYGAGLFPLYGIGGTKWSASGLTRYAATESIIGTMSLNPVVAWRISPKLALAVGVDLVYAALTSARNTNQSALGAGDGDMVIKAEGTGWGYNAGLLYQITGSLRAGLAYRSSVYVNFAGTLKMRNIAPAIQPLFGGAEYQSPIKTSMTFPQMASAALAYVTEGGSTITVEGEYGGWSSVKKSDLAIQNEVAAAGLVSSSSYLGWVDAWAIKAGVDYKYSETVSLRAGYFFATNPVPNHTIEPGNPNSNAHAITCGLGYAFGRYTADFSFEQNIYDKRTSNNGILNGTYESSTQVFGVGVGRQF